MTVPLPSLAKIDLKALPITAPPLAVFCWTAVTNPSNWSKETPASSAVEPALEKASARSFADTANAVSTAINLLIICSAVSPADVKPLIAAVKALTEPSASNPETLVRIRAAFNLFTVSSADKPCLASSAAPFATVSKVWPVFFATSNIAVLNRPNWSTLTPIIDEISVNLFSTSIVEEIKPLKAVEMPLIIETAAPKAKTRAVAALIDLSNSEAWPVILPNELLKLFTALLGKLILPKADWTWFPAARKLAGLKLRLALTVTGAVAIHYITLNAMLSYLRASYFLNHQPFLLFLWY